MTRRANYAATATAVMLALALAACGSDSTPTGDSGTTANITFKTDPVASVWIDGENKGQTPIVVAVEAGARDVVLKADGFEDMQETIAVEAGKDLTVDTGLMLAGTDVADYKRLLATLGIKHEAYGETPKAHRGSSDRAVMIYWPQSRMRRGSLGTYRIEVTDRYANDGYVEFRKGKTVLHREKFEADSLITERALPAKVIEAMKPGGKYSVGVYFDSKRAKPVVSKFELASRSKERAFDRKVGKIKRRQTYRRANALMREMADIDLLRDNRYYAEALTKSLRVLNTWPTTEMPFKSIAFCLERMKLKDTALYDHVGEALRGNSSVSARRTGLNTTNRDNATGGQTSGLPPSLVAPRVRQQDSGFKPGGMGVTPTPEAQKRQPGPIEPGAETPSDGDGGSKFDLRPRRSDPVTQEDVDAAQQLADEAKAAEDGLHGANEALEQANQAAEDAKNGVINAQADVQAKDKALQDAIAGGNQAAIDAAQAELEAANDVLSQAQQAQEQADTAAAEQAKAHAQATAENEGTLKRTGTADEAQRKADELREKLAAGGDEPQVGQPGQPGVGPDVPVDPSTPVDPNEGQNPDDGTPGTLPAFTPQQMVEQARETRDAAQQAIADLGTARADAQAALDQAQGDAQTAEQALQTLVDSGTATQDQIDDAQADVDRANEEVARSQMAVEQADGEIRSYESTLEEAERRLNQAEADALEHANKTGDGQETKPKK